MAAWGWDTIDTCDPAVSVIVEPARSAMLRCVAGGMTRSSVPITAQLGMVFQAVFSVAAVFAPRVIGALTCDNQPAVCLGKVLREGVVDGRRLEERLGIPFRGTGVADDVQNGSRVGNVERGTRPAKDLEDGLAHLGDERVNVHERLDVATGCSGVRDHHAPVGMADQDDRTCRALREKRPDVCGIARHAVEEVGRSEDGEALTLELGRYGVPARSICPCTVNKNDRWLRHVSPI